MTRLAAGNTWTTAVGKAVHLPLNRYLGGAS